MIELIVLGIMIAVMGFVIGSLGFFLYEKIKLELYYYKNPTTIEYSEFLACREPHQWVEMQLVLRDLLGNHRVCCKCGAIVGNSERMLSPNIVAQVNEKLRAEEHRLKVEEVIAARISRLREDYVERYIRKNFSHEINDSEYAQKLLNLAKYSIEAMTAATEKVAAEIEVQTELNAKYDGWTNKTGGNA